MSHFVGRLWDRFRRVFIGLVDNDESNSDNSNSKGGARTLDFVQSAIYNLKDKNGSCFEDILEYLCRQYDVDENTIRGRVMAALRRGVLIGVLEQNGNVYKLAVCRDKNKKHRRRKSSPQVESCDKCKRTFSKTRRDVSKGDTTDGDDGSEDDGDG